MPVRSSEPDTLFPRTAPIHCLVYIGLPSNPQFVGPQDPAQLARHILQSSGPSGKNSDYLYALDHGLEEMKSEADIGDDYEVDEHIADLVRRMEEEEMKYK